jgi:transglutaminase-like putative cysteine protease
MKLSIEAELVYTFVGDTQVIANLEASRTSDQVILSESLDNQPPAKFLSDTTPYGDRSIRASLSGDVTIRYSALVENNLRQLLPQSGLQHVWSELPSEVLPFLLPSRFCPSDKFMRFAQREFSSAGDGVARVMAILEWIHRNVDYVAGVSDAQTTAEETFVDRAGVCRDFTHLGITLCRALGIPARASAPMRCGNRICRTFMPSSKLIANGWWPSTPQGSPDRRHRPHGSGRDASDIAFPHDRQAMPSDPADNPGFEGNVNRQCVPSNRLSLRSRKIGRSRAFGDDATLSVVQPR